MKEFMNLLRRYVRPYNGYIAGSLALNILSAVFNIFSFSLIIPILNILFGLSGNVYSFIPWDTASVSLREKAVNNAYWYVSGLIGQHGAVTVLIFLALFMIGMTILKTACYFGASAVMVPIRTGLARDLRRDIYDKILRLPLGFFTSERKGDIIARMSGDVQEVETSVTGSIDMLVKNPVLIVFYVGTLFFISWQLTLFVLVFAPLMMWLMGAIGRNLKKQSSEAQSLWSDTMSQVDETLGGLRVVKAFLGEKKMSERFAAVTGEMRRRNSRVLTRQASAHPVSELLGTIMICIVLCFGGALVISGRSFIDAPTFIFYMVILYSVIQPIKDLAKAAYNIPKGMASMERIDRILNAQNTLQEAPDAVEIKDFTNEIEYRGVSFAYEEGREILHDIDLHIGKGRKIAIVGTSGGGKSTIADLLPRFYDVSKGSILIDGTDIRKLTVRSLRSLMGIVGQDPVLFNDTIFGNIAFGKENATMEEVVAAARTANAHEFIMEKEDGYLTNIGDRGVKLSGGQRQRLGIARAILCNPPILILDEATAALDTRSERLVQDALDKIMSQRTTIVIAHRLSTVRDADEIVVVEDGTIVERGTHEELLALGGQYKKLYEMQVL